MTHAMLSTIASVFAVGLAVGAWNGVAQSRTTTRESPSSGSYLYRVYCASCHGPTGRGDGPVADTLVSRPANLTVLTRQNGGVFPRSDVVARLDGTKPLPGHAPAEMPAWSEILRSTEGRDERTFRARVNALADHIESLQVK